jgi:hypothetical protein
VIASFKKDSTSMELVNYDFKMWNKCHVKKGGVLHVAVSLCKLITALFSLHCTKANDNLNIVESQFRLKKCLSAAADAKKRLCCF